MAAAAAAPDSDDEAFDHQLAQPPALPSDAVSSGLHCGLDLHHWTLGSKSEQVRCMWPSKHSADALHIWAWYLAGVTLHAFLLVGANRASCVLHGRSAATNSASAAALARPSFTGPRF
jgi:hypothetical protein